MANISLTSKLLSAGLLALSCLESVEAAVSQQDIDTYPDFAAAMAASGNNHDWMSYQM